MRNGQRLIYLDALRVLATFAVIALHVSAADWFGAPADSFAWQALNLYDSAARFCVPLFVMISGRLFLDPAKPIAGRDLAGKYIFRIGVAYIFWSACYSLINTARLLRDTEAAVDAAALKSAVGAFVRGNYHLWFLYMIAGLYLIVPFLRQIAADKGLTRYFLILSSLFSLVWPFILLFPLPAKDALITARTHLSLFFVMGYVVYFVGGYYFGAFPPSARARKVIYLAGLAGAAFTVVANSRFALLTDGAVRDHFYGYLLPTTAATALAVFLFFQTRFAAASGRAEAAGARVGAGVSGARPSARGLEARILLVSRYSFGMYLAHDLFLIALSEAGLSPLAFNPLLSVPLISAAIFAGSFLVSWLIGKIPVLSRYII
ncbi:MAG: acyltransferase family protein [Peptococcaceae bacterium]|jgi:surface polysaccharide O-acyltransferase-like enzyme|nr:acyltransferase family protein [Peptococcaceae bacterium]